MSNIVFSPASSAQQQFLLSDADIIFYGGELRLRSKPI
jgi:hypothetical protein